MSSESSITWKEVLFVIVIIIIFSAIGDCAGVGGDLWKPDY